MFIVLFKLYILIGCCFKLFELWTAKEMGIRRRCRGVLQMIFDTLIPILLWPICIYVAVMYLKHKPDEFIDIINETFEPIEDESKDE